MVDKHAMPLPEELFHRVQGATWISKLDCRSGFFNLVIAEESRPITAFWWDDGMRPEDAKVAAIQGLPTPKSADQVSRHAGSSPSKNTPSAWSTGLALATLRTCPAGFRQHPQSMSLVRDSMPQVTTVALEMPVTFRPQTRNPGLSGVSTSWSRWLGGGWQAPPLPSCSDPTRPPALGSTSDAFKLPQDIRHLTTDHLVAAGASGSQHQWLVVAGWPCQDMSLAGKAAGLRGTSYACGSPQQLCIPARGARQHQHQHRCLRPAHSRGA